MASKEASKKSTIHQYVRVVTTPLTERDLILLIYKYWPKCSLRLSPTVYAAILGKIAINMVPPVTNLEQLKEDINKIWAKRKSILKDNILYEQLEKERKSCLTDQQEELLTQIYQSFPKRIKSLTWGALSVLNQRLDKTKSDIQTVWDLRYKAVNGKERYLQWKNLPRMDAVEESQLNIIYKNWPKFKNGTWATRLTDGVKKQLNQKTKFTEKRIEFLWDLRKYTKGPDFNTYGTRLCAAVSIEDISLIQWYLDQGDDINEFGAHHCPLTLAIQRNNRKIIDFLLEQDSIKVNAQPSPTYNTPLLEAAQNGYIDIINLLLENDANPNQIGNYQKVTPFWLLLHANEQEDYDFDAIEMLFPTSTEAIQKASKNSHWDDGHLNILMLACKWHSNLIKPIMEKSHYLIDINSKSQHSWTALHFAVSMQNETPLAQFDDIKYILSIPGIDINIQNKYDQTPLDIFEEHFDANLERHLDIQALLLSKGAKNGVAHVQIVHDRFDTIERLVKEQVSREVSRSSSPVSALRRVKFNHSACLKFSLNQGNVGICYMVSIITLFRNEFSILRKLEECMVDEDIYNAKHNKNPDENYNIVSQTADFLSKDYSSYNFEEQCPTLPPSWEKSVYMTKEVTRESVVNGGHPTLLLLYILHTLYHWKPDVFKVFFGYLDQGNTEFGMLGHLEFETLYTQFKEGDHNIGLVHLYFKEQYGKEHCRLGPNIFDKFEHLYKKYTEIRGFLIRTAGDDNHGHVFAGSVCEDQVYYCNSWGNGCHKSKDIVEELIERDVSTRITHIHILLRK